MTEGWIKNMKVLMHQLQKFTCFTGCQADVKDVNNHKN
jgi:hypothetical protein